LGKRFLGFCGLRIDLSGIATSAGGFAAISTSSSSSVNGFAVGTSGVSVYFKPSLPPIFFLRGNVASSAGGAGDGSPSAPSSSSVSSTEGSLPVPDARPGPIPWKHTQVHREDERQIGRQKHKQPKDRTKQQHYMHYAYTHKHAQIKHCKSDTRKCLCDEAIECSARLTTELSKHGKTIATTEKQQQAQSWCVVSDGKHQLVVRHPPEVLMLTAVPPLAYRCVSVS
jgi:hypothetical protein